MVLVITFAGLARRQHSYVAGVHLRATPPDVPPDGYNTTMYTYTFVQDAENRLRREEQRSRDDLFVLLRQLKVDIDGRFDKIDEKFTKVDEKFTKMDEKIGSVVTRLIQIEALLGFVVLFAFANSPAANFFGSIASNFFKIP
jgi:hypothetical protein